MARSLLGEWLLGLTEYTLAEISGLPIRWVPASYQCGIGNVQLGQHLFCDALSVYSGRIEPLLVIFEDT